MEGKFGKEGGRRESDKHVDGQRNAHVDRHADGHVVEHVVRSADGVVEQPAKEKGGGKGEAKRKFLYVYGNYKRYYGYRLGRAFEEDPRLVVMRQEWFKGKR